MLVPGGFASSLADHGLNPGLIWVDGWALCNGRFQDLKLAEYAGPQKEVDIGDPDVQIASAGPVPILYGSLLGALRNDGWDICVCDYDWRKHMENTVVAARIVSCITQAYKNTKKPVHIITHSQGCLVARLALRQLFDALCRYPPQRSR